MSSSEITEEEELEPDEGATDTDSRSMPELLVEDEAGIPSYENDFTEGKKYLMQCGQTHDSMWNHLVELMKRMLQERPANIIDYFEEYSRRLKEERFETRNNHIRKVFVPPANLEFARRNLELIKAVRTQPVTDEDGLVVAMEPEVEDEEGGGGGSRKMGFLELMNYFREAGVGLSNDDSYTINIALVRLQQSAPVSKARFWGKLLGLHKNYIVAECEFTEEEVTKREEAEREKQEKEEEERLQKEEERLQKEEEERLAEEEMQQQKLAGGDMGEEEQIEIKEITLREKYKKPRTPITPEKVEVVVPGERYGEGTNKKVFYVCNNPGEEWIELPDATPQQIVVARKIRRYFTGYLNTKLDTFPKFPGNEANYLRAQIARISAGTQISPLGFYTFNEGGEEEEEPVGEEEGEGRTTYVENSEYEPLPLKDLTDPTMAFWVHHTLHILKQGRTAWWSSKQQKDEEEEAAAEEDEEEVEEEEMPETGPPLLTPLSEDISLETAAPWTVRQTSQYAVENAIALVASNLWPGAYAFACDRVYGNMYIGWGHKYLAYGYSPPPLPFPEYEYEPGPEVMEITDPTPEMEEEWRLAHEKKPVKGEGEEEEEEEEEEGEEIEEEDD